MMWFVLTESGEDLLSQRDCSQPNRDEYFLSFTARAMKFSFDVLPNSFTSCNMAVCGASRGMLMSALSDKIRVPRGIGLLAKVPRPVLAVWRMESMIVADGLNSFTYVAA